MPPVGGERGHGCVDQIGQGADLGAVIDLLGRERGRHDPARLGVEAEVQLPPRPARAGAVFLDRPFAGPAQLQPRAVRQQLQGLGLAIGSDAGP